MTILNTSLRRPLTVVVLVIAVCLGAWVALQRMTRDVFPPLNVPTIYVAQPFGGMDPALNMVRPLFATLPGVSAPPPFGGGARTILINVKPDRMRAYNFSPDEIVGAMSQANLISPSGNLNLGDKYPIVPVNAVVKN